MSHSFQSQAPKRARKSTNDVDMVPAEDSVPLTTRQEAALKWLGVDAQKRVVNGGGLKASKETFNKQLKEVLVAGTNITFDTTNPKETIISADVAAGGISEVTSTDTLSINPTTTDGSVSLVVSDLLVRLFDCVDYESALTGSIANNTLSLARTGLRAEDALVYYEANDIALESGENITSWPSASSGHDLEPLGSGSEVPLYIQDNAKYAYFHGGLPMTTAGTGTILNHYGDFTIFAIIKNGNNNDSTSVHNSDMFLNIPGIADKIWPFSISFSDRKKTLRVTCGGTVVPVEIQTQEWTCLCVRLSGVETLTPVLSVYCNGQQVSKTSIYGSTLLLGVVGNVVINGIETAQPKTITGSDPNCQFFLAHLSIRSETLTCEDIKKESKAIWYNHFATLLPATANPIEYIKLDSTNIVLHDGSPDKITKIANGALNTPQDQYDLWQSDINLSPTLISNTLSFSVGKYMSFLALLTDSYRISLPLTIKMSYKLEASTPAGQYLLRIATATPGNEFFIKTVGTDQLSIGDATNNVTISSNSSNTDPNHKLIIVLRPPIINSDGNGDNEKQCQVFESKENLSGANTQGLSLKFQTQLFSHSDEPFSMMHVNWDGTNANSGCNIDIYSLKMYLRDLSTKQELLL